MTIIQSTSQSREEDTDNLEIMNPISSLPSITTVNNILSLCSMNDQWMTGDHRERTRLLTYDDYDILHDKDNYMFLIHLEGRENKIAAVCYLPTTITNVVEFYHTEIPISHRNKGIGDRLIHKSLYWAKESGMLVIPTCAFVQQHLEHFGLQHYHSVLFCPLSPTIEELHLLS
ncbi:hypothetical protein BDB01DRAFT_330644 [Pilobolus umbonatus]|nr:hypothetical protein BDB01DRAFT_330644 [Pilobolus umbonatus]